MSLHATVFSAVSDRGIYKDYLAEVLIEWIAFLPLTRKFQNLVEEVCLFQVLIARPSRYWLSPQYFPRILSLGLAGCRGF